MSLFLQSRAQQTFSNKGQIVNILGFVGHMIFINPAIKHESSQYTKEQDNVKLYLPIYL